MPDPAPLMGWRPLWQLYALAALLRGMLLQLLGPDLRGDFVVYLRVALNMLSGCGVSLSGFAETLDATAPDTVCVPHFGGNGLPGYPAFIAAIWSVTGTSPDALLWVQLLVCSLCVPRLAYGVACLAGRRVGLAAGLVAALSPSQALLAIHPLTEALTCAIVTWLLAELALSIAQGRLRVGWIALVVSLGVLLRLDSLLLLVPVAVVGLWLHGVRAAAIRGVVLAVLVSLPLAAWTVRNLEQGVPVLPPARAWMLPDGSIGPLGYLAWLKQWVTTEEQRAATMYFKGDRYSLIHVVPGAFAVPGEGAALDALLAALRAHEGQPFPPGIDRRFQALADQAAGARSPGGTVALRAAQGWGLWRSWASPMPPATLRLAGPADRVAEIIARSSRCLLGALFVLSVAGLAFGSGARRPLVVAALAMVVVKTVLGVAGLFLEERYTVTAVPLIELAVLLSLADLLGWLLRHRGVPRRPAP